VIRPQEKIIAKRSAIYAVSVHIILILIMIVSFEWRVKLPQVAEVELWDSIPQRAHLRYLLQNDLIQSWVVTSL